MKKNKILRIGLAFNMKRKAENGEVEDKYAEFDDESTIIAIKNAIKSAGYNIVLLEADEKFPERVMSNNIDFVFNIAEGMRGESRESHVPAILEMLGIPYTGSGILTHAISLDKKRTKQILIHDGVPTPKYQLFSSSSEPLNNNLRFPLFVKPNAEGSSKGIRNNSLVNNEKDMRKVLDFVISNYSQPAMVEEYLEGREFTVAVLGNDSPKVLPIVEVTFDYLPAGINKFDSYEVKWYYDNPDNHVDPIICPAKVDEKLRKNIEDTALRAYNSINCYDFCRMDMRLDSEGVPNVIDINTLPGLIPDPKENSRFPRACFTAGMSYNQIIREILNSGLKRYGLLR